jgi:hypothetical protein
LRPKAYPLKLALGYAIETIEGVGEFADEHNQSGRLGIGFGAALLPFFHGALVDAQLADEDGAGPFLRQGEATQATADGANQFRVNRGQRRRLNFVGAQCQAAMAVTIDRGHAFD